MRKSKKLQNWKTYIPERLRNEQGRLGWILLWLIGVPVPVLFILYLLRGCT